MAESWLKLSADVVDCDLDQGLPGWFYAEQLLPPSAVCSIEDLQLPSLEQAELAVGAPAAAFKYQAAWLLVAAAGRVKQTEPGHQQAPELKVHNLVVRLV